jgi:Tfp pilus assembly protein PilO
MQQALAGALFGLGLLFYFVAYRPQMTRAQLLSAEIVQKEGELSRSQTQAKALPAVQADINHLLAKLADVKKLPTNPGFGEFQIQMSQFARQDNLRDPSISCAGTPRRDGQYYELPVSLKFDGDFRDVFTFLSQIEDMPRLTRIKSLNVHSLGDNGAVQVDLLMILYYSEG